MPTVLITGGTGTIGKRLTALLLQKGYSVNILSREKKQSSNPMVHYYQWDIHNQTIEQDAVQSANFIIHLAGAGVADKRWSTTRKNEIKHSRISSSKLIVDALQHTPNNVETIVSASAIGWYGPDSSDTIKHGFDETDPAYPDFLGETCKDWENSIAPVVSIGKRLVILRTGIVLSNDGGALVEFKIPLKFKLATILGSGKQMISWIHIDDLCNQYIFAIENAAMHGVYNAVAPTPISNKELIITLAKQICGKWFLPVYVPSFLLKIVLGEMSIEVLKSTTVSAQKIINQGFHFEYPFIKNAIIALTASKL
jgi:uncharacterized protein (TIGR01777 family)